jgi:ketosteroid isomerase-like protein
MSSPSGIRQFVQEWYDKLSDHVPVEQLLPMVSAQNLEMVFPEKTVRNEADFRDWYQYIGHTYADQSHTLEKLDSRPDRDGTHVDLTLIWKATQRSDGSRLTFRAEQSWLVGTSPGTGEPVIVNYRVEALSPLPVRMTPREVLDEYYRLVNGGDWDRWYNLFAETTVLDEQLAGRIEGLAALRETTKGFGGYARFQNVPQHVIVEGDQAAVVSHISAVTASGAVIEAGVMNYFCFDDDGKISYMANFHDTLPFAAVVNQG